MWVFYNDDDGCDYYQWSAAAAATVCIINSDLVIIRESQSFHLSSRTLDNVETNYSVEWL